MCLLFAEFDVASVIGGGVVTSILAAFGGAVVWMSDRHRRNRKDAIDELNAIILQKDVQIGRQQAQIDEQQKTINRMRDLFDDCRCDAAELWALYQLLHGVATQLKAIIVCNKIPVEGFDIPPLPTKPVRGRESEVDYLQRSTQMGADLTKSAAATAKTLPNPLTTF